MWTLLFVSTLTLFANTKETIEYFEMKDGTLINAALYNMQNIESYKQYNGDANTLPVPIVLLHSFMTSRRYWDTLLSVMLNRTSLYDTHPIITISLRGMGDSQYINVNTVNTYLTNIDDILTVLSHIGINEHIKCIFIGQSFGSMITNQMVIHNSNRVFGIVIMGTLAYIDDTVQGVIDSFKWHDCNNWTYALTLHADRNWDVSYNDGRISKEFWKLMKSEQTKLKYEIMTQTVFEPYDLRNDIITNQYFQEIPIVLVRGNMDFIPYETVQPFMEIGDNVKVLNYECQTCDHDIVLGHEEDICDALHMMIVEHHNLFKTDL